MNTKKTLFILAIVLIAAGIRAQSPGPLPSTDAALEIYSQLTGRTVLRPGLLPRLQDWNAEDVPKDTNAAVRFIEAAFAKSKIELLPDGELFVRVLPEGWKNTPLAAALARIKPPAVRKEPVPEEDLLAAGMVDFPSMPLDQMLAVYTELRSRTILRPAVLPPPTFYARHLLPRRRLTREEASYALSVTLVLNGLAVVDDGEKFVQIVPLPRLPQVRAKAPKPDADARTGDPEKLPKFQPGFAYDASSRPTMNNLIEFYAGFTGRSPEVTTSIGMLPVHFVMNNPLTASEITYAIETTLELNGLKIVPGEGNSFRVERAAERAGDK